MAKGYSKETVGVRDNTLVPALKADGRVYHARLRSVRATLDLSQATVARNIGDTNSLGAIPRGHRFVAIELVTGVTLGAAQVAIGNATDAAAYAAAATYTTPDAPARLGKAAARAADPGNDGVEVLMTISTAALPGSGVMVFDLFYAGR